jgi:hypothetical protein
MSNFERARNKMRLRWAGDPERWGGSVELSTNVMEAPTQAAGGQLVRAQTEDLIAIGWGLFATATLAGLQGTDQGAVTLEVTFGAGQTTLTAFLIIGTIAAGVFTPANAAGTGFAIPDPWIPALNGRGGLVVLNSPIPACAVSARPLMFISHVAGQPDHIVTLRVNAVLSPRSWVP